jgi:Ser/Thr protein kinase RdoA (MazF antagonist)
MRMPSKLVHGDFWDNNVLFRHGRPVLLADFDFIGNGPASTTWRSRCGVPCGP